MLVKLIGIVLGVVVLAVIGVGSAVYFGIVSVPWSSAPPEHSARYYPDDVMAKPESTEGHRWTA